MKIRQNIILLLLPIVGCASLVKSERAAINFSQIEGLNFSQTNREFILSHFGTPDDILSHEQQNEEQWTYLESAATGAKSERLTLQFDRDKGSLLGATWFPREGDKVFSRKEVLANFKDSKFITKEKGIVAKHYYSDDATYIDAAKGLSFFSFGGSANVYAISWRNPETRQLSNRR